MNRVDIRWWALLASAVLAGCGSQDGKEKPAPALSTPAPSVPPSAHAGQLVAHLQNSYRVPIPVTPHAAGANAPPSRSTPLLPSGVATAFVRDPANRLVPSFDTAAQAGTASTPAPAAMGLGSNASDAFDLRDVASGLSVSVTLLGANDASVEVADGYLVYPAAYEGGADILSRPYPSGTEQSLSFASRPSAEQIVYDVALGQGVAGVRLVSNTVEFLDANGAPRLRMAPPFVSGAQSTSAWPTVTVQSCAVDTNPAAPWNRPIVSPGAAHCAVTVDWSQGGIQYPALLDPSWSVGTTMAVARMHHASARVTAGGKELALVFGGYAFTSTVASAELFDESSGTWAQTGALVADVSYVPAVTLSSGTALAVGGFRVTTSGGIEYDGVQAYNPTAGTWSLQGHLGSAREEHTATLLNTGNVLVAGGFGEYPQIFANALLYNPSTGTATAAGSMQSARGDHSATLLNSGKVLVVDGMGASSVAQSAADLYDPTANAWSVVPAPPVPARFSHLAPLLPSGKVLMVGGEDLSAGIAQTLGTAIYDPTAGTWSAGPATVSSHYLGTATVLTQGNNSGKVLLAGGDFALTGVELFDPTAVTWTAIAPLLTGRDAHVAVSLTNGILLAGGSDSNGTLLSSGELYSPDVAATAPQWPAGASLTAVVQGPTSATLSWSAAADPNGVANYAIYDNGQLVTTLSGTTDTYTATGLTPGASVNFTVQAVDPSGAPSWSGPTAKYLVVPPSASSVASSIDRSVATALGPATSFLYTGADPVQTGVASGTIVSSTAAAIRGHVYGSGGSALAGVTVTVVNHPEFGSTLTQADGEYDLVVNGGQTLRLHYALASYLPVERLVQAPWQDYVTVNDVFLLQLDPEVTPVTMSSSTTGLQVARGSTLSDSAGTRTATLFIPPGAVATMTLPDGSTAPLTTMSVRATEYSVGTNGPNAMPATLPPASAYAYAVELSADEALAAGATKVAFSETLPLYVENFLGLPVGTSLPSGSYSPAQGAWVPSTNGLVLNVLSVSGGTASLDIDGSGTAASTGALAGIGISNAEQQTIATLYTAGQTLWRMPTLHFSGRDVSPDDGPPPGAPDDVCNQRTCKDGNGNDRPCQVGVVTIPCMSGDPAWPACGTQNPCTALGYPVSAAGSQASNCGPYHLNFYCCPAGYSPLACTDCAELECSAQSCPSPVTTCNSPPPPPPPDPNGPGDCRDPNASTIECQRMSLGEDLPIAGTPYSLHYESDRQRGRQPTLNIPLSGATLPTPVSSISLQVSLAGRLFTQSFPVTQPNPQPNQSTTFTWDGKDGYGRLLEGSQPVTVQVSEVYTGVYQNSGAFGVVGSGTPMKSSPMRQPFTLSTSRWTGTIPLWDSQPQGFGGWTLDVQHTYDVTGRMLRLGDGTNRTLNGLPPIIQTIAGNGQASGALGDGGSATSAVVASPQAVAVGPDGSVYVVAQNCVRKVDPGGNIRTFAGQCASPGFSGDNGPATSAQLQSPEDIAFGPDGSLYIADTVNMVVRRVAPGGTITTVAGTGSAGNTGNGEPAVEADLNAPYGIDVGPDGTLYIAEKVNAQVRAVSPDGIIRLVAGFRRLVEQQRERRPGDGSAPERPGPRPRRERRQPLHRGAQWPLGSARRHRRHHSRVRGRRRARRQRRRGSRHGRVALGTQRHRDRTRRQRLHRRPERDRSPSVSWRRHHDGGGRSGEHELCRRQRTGGGRDDGRRAGNPRGSGWEHLHHR